LSLYGLGSPKRGNSEGHRAEGYVVTTGLLQKHGSSQDCPRPFGYKRQFGILPRSDGRFVAKIRSPLGSPGASNGGYFT